jgi:hypothetical protein
VRAPFKAPGEDDSWFRAELDCSQCSSTIQLNRKMKIKNMTTLHFKKSIGRSLSWRCGFVLVPLALVCFGLSPTAKAQLPAPSPDGGYPGANTAEGNNALHDVNTAVGINNTAVGANALTHNTTGGYNVGIGSGALASNTTGNFNMAIGTEALTNNNANFNLAIGFRVGFMNTTGKHLTGIGAAALRNNTTGDFNTAIGADALRENTIGEQNTAIGADALSNNNQGGNNTATGFQALQNNDGDDNNAFGFNALGANVGAVFGDMNNAFGANALASNVEGRQNSAFGDDALEFSNGDRNTAFGNEAGTAVTTGSFNVYLGDNAGSNFNHVDESNTIRIGSDTGFDGIDPTRCFIAGIANNPQPTAGTVFDVSIETAAGVNFQRLGIDTSSRRFKEDIKPMDKLSEAIFKLKPVTYRIKKETNPAQPMAFGLIAEDVAEACPALASYLDGQPMGVHYKEMSVMLLNEFLKEHKKVEQQQSKIDNQQASIAELKATVAQQAKGMEVLTAQLREQAAQIQKVSAQVEMSKPAAKVVNNNQ